MVSSVFFVPQTANGEELSMPQHGRPRIDRRDVVRSFVVVLAFDLLMDGWIVTSCAG